ncbi:hypothetical protein HLASF_1564 [Halanaeroarchaeum sulfurireducens]|uniref:Uncharacterized protein n=1 Tax=Halanaeroarchaeum sulfurireducens TaxID=1604004 RepID=A0A0F7PFE4_9EURY|nr:hypothetical protein HLASF_1564 [Halanaeroarchaeum sulfurireducens]ALG82437.1 hypothetical protein HLASA_1551 [Halanaeroarchaeum sulfurireducens]
MGRNTATVKYGIGSLIGNTFNMYVFGSGILSLLRFSIGIIQTGSFEGAFNIAIEFYIAKLTPFPLNEFLTASGFLEVAISISVALGIGVGLASYRYRKNRF